MGSPGVVLALLAQFWALQGATRLCVQQRSTPLEVKQGDRATLECWVTQAPPWERLRVGWTKDGDVLCQPYVTNGSLSLAACGPRGQLSWQAPGNLSLKLDPVRVNDSGHYICWAVMEIPELDKADGNGTQLLVDPTGQPPGTAAKLSGCQRRGAQGGGEGNALSACPLWVCPPSPGHSLYSNVLPRPPRVPRRNQAWPGKGLDTPRAGRRVQSIYSTSFPSRPATCRPPGPSCRPRPSHPGAPAGVSPGPGPAGQPRPTGLPKGGKEPGAPGDTKGTPCGYMKV
ncbi:transmembrane and immunoglobulin domain-containing protein 2 [Carlito syrichta]|uniref:transmembrane and immunoglobulin domain-containing protein 2 n=1 Tax=Carlito syrichta TaxID=1868482 RepID=UPI000B52C468|nr:transmembrane and immunoglobulin domain-containing protein 2 [Carlito syrichta]